METILDDHHSIFFYFSCFGSSKFQAAGAQHWLKCRIDPPLSTLVTMSWQEVQSLVQQINSIHRKELIENVPILPPQPNRPLTPPVTQTHSSAGTAFLSKTDKSMPRSLAQTSCRNTIRAKWKRNADLHHHRWKVFTQCLLSYHKAVRPVSVLAHRLTFVFSPWAHQDALSPNWWDIQLPQAQLWPLAKVPVKIKEERNWVRKLETNLKNLSPPAC